MAHQFGYLYLKKTPYGYSLSLVKKATLLEKKIIYSEQKEKWSDVLDRANKRADLRTK